MRAVFAVLALSIGLVAFRASAAETLTVCLEGDAPPFSYHDGKKAAGFDVAVATAVAAHLNRDLKIQWFEISKSPDQDEPDPARSENALLNYGRCQLVGGFPLIANDLMPADDKSRLPDFAGETRDERKQWVPIGKLIASKPYYYYPFTVLLGPTVADHKIASLDDLAGLRIASEDGTLADAILMWYGHRKYFRQVTHYTPGKSLDHGGGLLEHLDRGDFDATLVALRRYDAYRAQHPDTKIVTTGYYNRLGFNIGYVAKPSDLALVGRVNAAVDDLMTRNQLPTMAKREGMTYVAPRQPAVARGVTLGDLIAGDDK
jgi:ABC-type amino acid transport substrate-binding protein